jgi:ABC-2 type transport system permease protein
MEIKKQLIRRLRILRAFAIASLQADLEYRFNFVVRVFTDILWYLAQLILFETLYLHTKSIGGWELSQTRVFLGILFVVDSIYMIFFHDNLDMISSKVRKGDLDLLLVKPMSSQFLISCQRMAVAYLGNFIMAIAWLGWSINRLPVNDINPWLQSLWLLVLIPAAVTVTYCLKFFFATLAVIFVQAQGIQYMWYQLYKLGTRPDVVYVKKMRLILMSIVPMAMIASVPARSVIMAPDLSLIAYTCGMALLLLWLTTKFWKFALTKYVSASS